MGTLRLPRLLLLPPRVRAAVAWLVQAAVVVSFAAGCAERRSADGDAGPLADALARPDEATSAARASPSSPTRAPTALEPTGTLPSARLPIDLPPVAPAPMPTPSPVAEWVWTVHRGDHFSVLFPGEPKLRVLPAEEDRSAYTEAKLDVPGGQVSFSAGYTEHTKEEVAKPDAFLDERVNAPRRGLTDVLTKRSVTLPGGQPGRVLILRRDISGTPLRIYSRLYLVGLRLYSLVVSTLDVGGVGEDVVKKFMDSFKLLP